jgi:predicted enzyme related to lactoylglutathione lyase
VKLAPSCNNRPALATYDPSRLGARLVFVALRVRDLEASARFYREVIGIPLRDAGGLDEETHCEYSWTDGEYLHFALFPAARGAETRSVELAFYVADLDLAHAQVTAAGAEVASMPQDQPWGRTAAYRDPDGNLVGLTQRPEWGRTS